MENLKHTKGPWAIMTDPDNDPVIYRPGDEGVNTAIADVYAPEDSEDRDNEALANAKLIAAAPELLDELMSMVPILITHYREFFLSQEQRPRSEDDFNRFYNECNEKALNHYKVKQVKALIKKATE